MRHNRQFPLEAICVPAFSAGVEVPILPHVPIQSFAVVNRKPNDIKYLVVWKDRMLESIRAHGCPTA